LTTILPMNTKITPGKYQVTATCGEDGVLRQGFHDPASANEAFREVLVRYPACEVKLIDAGVVLISAGPAPLSLDWGMVSHHRDHRQRRSPKPPRAVLYKAAG
jgi:hypothetical protein